MRKILIQALAAGISFFVILLLALCKVRGETDEVVDAMWEEINEKEEN